MSSAAPGRPAATEWVGLGIVLIVAAAFAVNAWVGPAPFGSDNDEYRMLAESLYERGEPVIAGVEGTKYPLGWSLLIGAIDRLGGDDTYAPIGLNVGLVLLVAVVVWLIGRQVAPEAGLVAAGLVAVAPAVWEAVWAVMPDILLLAVTALALLVVVRSLPREESLLLVVPALRTRGGTDRRHDLHEEGRAPTGAIVALTALALAAALLKTMGLLVAGALTVALLARPGLRKWSPLPLGVALVATAAQAAFVAPYPSATTGYGAVFWLRDPFDAAAGRIHASDLPSRMVERAEVVLRQVANALLGTGVPRLLGWTVALLVLTAGVLALRRWRWTALALTTATLLTLAVWPFASTRFALSLVPVAAVGAGAAIAVLHRRAGRAGPILAAVVALALFAVQVPRGWSQLSETTAAHRAHLEEFHAATDQLAAWAAAELGPDDRIASLDYRELAYRVDQPVAPMSYTTDADVLLEQSAGSGADWFVVLEGLTPRRRPPVQALLSTYPERFGEPRTFGRARVYPIAPTENPSS